MGVNLSDLPPELRRQIEAEHGLDVSGSRHRDKAPKTGRREKPSRSTPGSCGDCDWTGTDRHDKPNDCRQTGCDCFLTHMVATGHHRFQTEAT